MTFVFWTWFILAFVFIALEVFISSGTYLLWMGLASIVVGLTSYLFPELGLVYEGLLFGVTSLVSVLLWRYVLKDRFQPKGSTLFLNQRGSDYFGTVLTLTSPLQNGHGILKIGDTQWRLKGPDLPAGTKVKITGLDGNALVVEEVPSSEIS